MLTPNEEKRFLEIVSMLRGSPTSQQKKELLDELLSLMTNVFPSEHERIARLNR